MTAPYPPTQKQLALLRLLAAAQTAGQPVPSYWELSRDLSIARSGVHRLMTGLETRGWIERRRGSPRCVRLLHPVPGTLTVEAAFRAGHVAASRGWPFDVALTAWRAARGLAAPPPEPDHVPDLGNMIGPDHGLPSTEDVRGILKPAPGEGGDADPAPEPDHVADGEDAAVVYASADDAFATRLIQADVDSGAARVQIVERRFYWGGILKPAPGEGGDADPVARPPLPAEREGRN